MLEHFDRQSAHGIHGDGREQRIAPLLGQRHHDAQDPIENGQRNGAEKNVRQRDRVERKLAGDRIEVGDFPASVLEAAQAAAGSHLRPVDGAADPNLMNAPSIATELAEKIQAYRPGNAAHVINLSLLPLTGEDADYLERRLGHGAVTVLSRGYGNCRISSTAVKNAWRVRYFNSREAVILDTIEVARVPAVARAAKEDLEDSAQRLDEILGVYR